MGYKLNKTNGALVVDLLDGVVDTRTTDLALFGRNYKGYGEYLNENFIALLENFANTTQPVAPLTGQLWYSTAEQKLKVFNGTEFNNAGAPIVAPTEPVLVAGDQWINNSTKQLWFNDGSETILAGPIYSAQQGVSGFTVSSLVDVQGRLRTVVNLSIGGELVAVLSNLQFTPAVGNTISGLPSVIEKGFNLVDPNEFKFPGIAAYASALITEDGQFRDITEFLPTNADGLTIGALTISNDRGLTLGASNDAVHKIEGDSYVVENQLVNRNYRVRIKSSNGLGIAEDAIAVIAENRRVGIFTETPEYTLDVSGDLRVTGNLLVQGTNTVLNTSTLAVEDKNIELAKTPDGVPLDDSAVSGAGITVVAAVNKQLTWEHNAITPESSAWYSTEHFDLAPTKTFKIEGSTVLSKTALGLGITDALGLARVGQLESLQVDNITIDGATISSSSSLSLTSAGPITVNNQVVAGVAAPVNSTDAVNKQYLEQVLAAAPVYFALDITGLSDANIASIINDMAPAVSKSEGAIAMIHTTSLADTEVTGIDMTVRDITAGEPDTGQVFELYKVPVDANGSLNQPVVRDFAAVRPASGAVSLVVIRGLKRFVVDNAGSGNFWRWDADLESSV
jgi:hypothetical protein